jgi:hypothetical protein
VFAVPHTPVVFAGLLVQSALVQQPAVGMHRLVPGQFLNPVLHAIPHVPPVQLAEPLDAGVGQETQVDPQKLVLVSGWQTLLQGWLGVGVMHTPPQAFAVGMHAPKHSFIPVGQAC